jgi:AhpD family alkylhydroperoxidase
MMSKNQKSMMSIMLVLIAIFCTAISLYSQGEINTSKNAEAEMKEAFGTVPAMFKVYPEHMRASAWEWFKSADSPDAAIPAKYSELISLGVASQIPCSYCIYAHTTRAKLLGATDQEIQEAVASAANTRHWSTVLNGAGVEFEQFKKEWDNILEHVKKQSAEK